MEMIKMTHKNIDGVLVEKEIESNLVSVYKSMGWEIKEEKPKYEFKSSFSTNKKINKNYDNR